MTKGDRTEPIKTTETDRTPGADALAVEPPEDETPNANTRVAIRERDEMVQHPEKYRRYAYFAEFMKEE